MNRKTPKTTDGLMRHIRDNKGIQINGSTEKTSYETSAIFMDSKGIISFLNKEEELNFEKFSELHALYSFDTEIKTFSINTLCSVKRLLKIDC